MYKIISVHDNYVTCLEQGRFPIAFPETPTLKWNNVGVFKLGSLGSDPVVVNNSTISGKVLIVQNLLITCPSNILKEH